MFFGVDPRGQLVDSRGAGDWRSAEDRTYDCIQYGYHLDGAVSIGALGGASGLGQVDVGGGRQQPVQLFALTVRAAGDGLRDTTVAGQGFGTKSLSTPWGFTCMATAAAISENGSATVGCNFEDVPLRLGGTFFDNDTYTKRGDPNRIEVRSCRIDVRLLGVPPSPTPASAPRPDGCGPGRRC